MRIRKVALAFAASTMALTLPVQAQSEAPQVFERSGNWTADFGEDYCRLLRTFRSGQLLGYKKPGWKCDVFFGQNLVCHSPPGSTLAVGDEVEATPRRPRGLFSSGVRGVDWI